MFHHTTFVSCRSFEVPSWSFYLLSKFYHAVVTVSISRPSSDVALRFLYLLFEFESGTTLFHLLTSWLLRSLCKTNFMEQCTRLLGLLNVQKQLFEYADYTRPTATKYHNSDSHQIWWVTVHTETQKYEITSAQWRDFSPQQARNLPGIEEKKRRYHWFSRTRSCDWLT